MRIATKGGRVDGYLIEGGEIKDIPFSSITRSDLDRWFKDGQKATRDPVRYYERVAVLFRCVNLIAQSIANMPRQIVDMESGEVVAAANFNAPQVDDAGRPLTEKDLPFEIDLDDLLWRTVAAELLLGEAYWHKLRNRVRLTEVRWFDPRTIKPAYDRRQGLRHFRREVSGLATATIQEEDMVYFWRPGLQELGPGTAPGQVASRSGGIADNMDKFVETFFEKGAMPTIVVFAETEPPTGEKSRIKKYLERILTGVGNAFGIEVLSASLKFEKLTPPLKEMIIPDIKDGAQRDICIDMGVPFSMIFSDAANRAVSEQDDLHFYTKTSVPEALFLQKKANRYLFEEQGLQLVFRPDQLEIFQAREIRKAAASIWLFDRGAIDKDELREAAGYPPRTEEQKAQAGEEEEVEEEEQNTAATGQPGSMKRPAALKRERSNGQSTKREELAQWERKVIKRWPGRAPYTIPFEPNHLAPAEVAAVRRGLIQANGVEEVKAAFAAPFRQALKTAREDSQALLALQKRGATQIQGAMRLQYEAIQLAPGGETIDAVMASMQVTLDESSAGLQQVLVEFLGQGAAIGTEAAAARMPFETGAGFSWELANADAAAFVEEYSFDLVTGINETSAKRLRAVLANWVEEGGTLEELADGIRPIFADAEATRVIEAIFGVDRAEMIAETEATRAYAEGKIVGYMASDLAEQPPNVKPPDDSHPRCRCDIDIEKQDDGSWHWIWYTAADDLVCDICGPRHLQSVGVALPAPESEE